MKPGQTRKGTGTGGPILQQMEGGQLHLGSATAGDGAILSWHFAGGLVRCLGGLNLYRVQALFFFCLLVTLPYAA